jgi:hypothetical protein
MTIFEQILAGLQTKFTGVDTATLTRIATTKSAGVTDEGQVKTIVDGVNFTDVLSNYGDARADEAARSSVKNYEKKNGLKDGKPIEKGDEGSGGNEGNKGGTPVGGTPNNGTPDFAKIVAESISTALQPIAEELATLKNEKVESDFSARVSEAAKKYGINDGLVKMLNVPKDADLDQFMQDAKQKFTDAGFQEVKAPESADAEIKKESETIAEQINNGTKEIVEQESKN